MKNYNCDDCCSGGCGPAKYDCMFDIKPSPYDPTTWVITQNGVMRKIKAPTLNETDTAISTNSSNATLNYKAEKHNDAITGKQLGDLINVDELRNVNVDESLPGTCYEFVYRKYGDCGSGCKALTNAWTNFNINSEGGKQNAIRFVRGSNVYGCPAYLDTPSNLDEYWLAGWKTDGENKEFGYFQPQEVEELPQDEDGNTLVMSINPTNGRPVVGSLPFQKSLNNIIAGLGMNVFGTFSVIQETPNFGADLNSVTGDFIIHWSDWWNSDLSRHVGDGKITGRLIWEPEFNANNGKMFYHISGIYFDTMSFKTDEGFPTAQDVYITVKGVQIGTGVETTVVNRYEHHGNTDWTHTIDQTISCDFTVECAPNTTVGPFNFAYILNDTSILDDEGFLQTNFQNKLPGWEI